MSCSHNNNIIDNSLTKSKGLDFIEGAIAPIGSGSNLTQVLAMVGDGNFPGDAEVWVRSFDSEVFSPQMSASVDRTRGMDSSWHLACLACNAAELEVELWG